MSGRRHEGSAPTVALLDRDAELDVVGAAMAAAAAVGGRGGAVAIEGPAGFGKTALVEELGRRASASGLQVRTARGAALEQGLGLGVARQLFAELPAGPVGSAVDDGPAVDAGPVLHRLTVDHAERSPLLLVVDDLQWADAPSVRALAYLLARLRDLPVVLATTWGPAVGGTDRWLRQEVVAHPHTRRLALAPLGEAAVAELLGARLGIDVDPAFATAARRATGGVPALIGLLAEALVADGIAPTAAAADVVDQLGPATVAHATLLRVGRLGPDAVAVTRALAVLGPRPRLDVLAALAGLDTDAVRAVAVDLTDHHVVADEPELHFAQPLVGRAVYRDLSTTQRAQLHGRAAGLLAERHAPCEAVAAHVVRTPPEGRPDVVHRLRRAASAALARGARAEAATYLARATDEGAVVDGAVVVGDVGATGAFVDDLAGTVAAAVSGRPVDLAAADRALDHARVVAVDRGSVVAEAAVAVHRASLDTARGRLADAAALLAGVAALPDGCGLLLAHPRAVHGCVDAIVERPELDVVADALEVAATDGWLAVARGRVRAARGCRSGAVADLAPAVEVGGRFERGAAVLALALVLADDADPAGTAEARRLVAAELDDAERQGDPVRIGATLRGAGLLAGGADGIARLEMALTRVDAEGPAAALERARVLVDLGAALRRADQRVAARHRLAAGLDAARRVGAVRLAERAAEELRLAGARPRRPALSGPASLTPGEERVARLAAAGGSTREIARALYVTPKTVENQLGATFRKLGVRSRRELAGALET